MPSLARSVPKPLKVPSLARPVPKPLSIFALDRRATDASLPSLSTPYQLVEVRRFESFPWSLGNYNRKNAIKGRKYENNMLCFFMVRIVLVFAHKYSTMLKILVRLFLSCS